MKNFFNIESCRICGSRNLRSFLNLGDMPLSNRLLTESDIPSEERYPLEVLLCQDCNLSQLSAVVDPEVLFRDYVYRSSISNSFSAHCEDLADELNRDFLRPGELVVDIASNDGCLLRPFKGKGNKVLGIDPATNLAKIANESGIETVPEFWSPDLADKLVKKFGTAKAITAFNVFAHVHDVHSFVRGIKRMLDPQGYFIIESPHLSPLVRNVEFDTIYHEHLSYLLLKPIKRLMENYGLRVARVKKFDIHGGSIRVYIEHSENQETSDGSTQEILDEEQKAGLYGLEAYDQFRRHTRDFKDTLTTKIRDILNEGKTVAAFGASAKGNILLNYCGIGKESVGFIVDDTPEKQGKLSPGVHIPIVPRRYLSEHHPDYLLILAWNFADEIIRKTQDYRASGGRYIIPLPKIKIL